MEKSYLLASDLLMQKKTAAETLNEFEQGSKQIPLVIDPKAVALTLQAFYKLPEKSQEQLNEITSKIAQNKAIEREDFYRLEEAVTQFFAEDEEHERLFPAGDDGPDDGDGKRPQAAVTIPTSVIVGIIVIVIIVGILSWVEWYSPGAVSQYIPNWTSYYLRNPGQAWPDTKKMLQQPFDDLARHIEEQTRSAAFEAAAKEMYELSKKMGPVIIHGPNDPNGPIWVDTSGGGGSAPSGDEDAKEPEGPKDPPPMA